MKNETLIPVVVQDAQTREVLMLAYANQEALKKTKQTGFAWFYSRSRKELWKKGRTSGNTMRVESIRWDCDQDALLYLVLPAGPACHTGKTSCFGKGATRFNLDKLFRILEARKKNAAKSSYTAQLLKNPSLLNAKLLEEAAELVQANNQSETVWEAADVIYFTLVKLIEKKTTLDDVLKELKRRNQSS